MEREGGNLGKGGRESRRSARFWSLRAERDSTASPPFRRFLSSADAANYIRPICQGASSVYSGRLHCCYCSACCYTLLPSPAALRSPASVRKPLKWPDISWANRSPLIFALVTLIRRSHTSHNAGSVDKSSQVQEHRTT